MIAQDGNMIRKLEKSRDYAWEGEADFPLFGEVVRVFIYDENDLEYAQKCVEELHRLPLPVIEKLCEFSIAYCEDFREYFEDEDIPIPEGIQSREILKYIQPSSLIIKSPSDERIAIHLELDCDWEPEHGMEWIVLDGEVLYVGSFHGENPWRGREYFADEGKSYVMFPD